MGLLKTVCGAAALVTCLASGARADEWNKLTYLTFSSPVQVPGATLPAGTYAFKVADLSTTRHIVQIFDRDQKKLFVTAMAIPDQRPEPADEPVVMFSERPAGTPPAIKAWFYPGRRIGDEFIYPRRQAMEIARATHQPVMSMPDDTKEESEAMSNASVERVDETGKMVVVEETTVAIADVPDAREAEPVAPDTSSLRPVGTSGEVAAPRALPQTASELPLLQLLGGLAFAGAWGARALRSRLTK